MDNTAKKYINFRNERNLKGVSQDEKNANNDRNYHNLANISQDERNSRTSYSYGIACCRFVSNKPEILIVCKRTTYGYFSFVKGKYSHGDNQALMRCFNQMTVDEKLDILSLNFTQIWYRLYFNSVKNQTYYIAKNKFETNFLTDQGAKLRKLISKSTNGYRIWEIPKGKKKSKTETDLACAMREFEEETFIKKSQYKVLSWSKRGYSFIDSNVTYNNTYYIALASPNAEPKLSFSSPEQLGEICDVKWATLDEIKLIDESGKLTKFVRPIMKFIKKYKS